MMKLDAQGIAYMAVPKAACSSIKTALSAFDTAKGAALADQEVASVHAAYPTRRFSAKTWVTLEGYWRFTVVRDPIRRLMSVYTDIIMGRHELFNSPNIRTQTALSANPDPDFFFQNLGGYAQLASVVKHHVLPVQRFTGPKPLQFDQVFRVGEMPALAEALKKRIGKKVVIARLNPSKTTLAFDELKPETRDALRGRLMVEYDHLSDYFQNPF